MTTLDTARGAYTYFNPTREMPANWIYAFGLWLFLWLFAKCVFLVQFQFWPTHTATPAANILLFYSPLPAQVLCFVAITAYATGLGNYRLAHALRWTNSTPVRVRLGRLYVEPSAEVTAALCVAAGFGLFFLNNFLYASIGGPVTRADDFAAKFPQTIPYTAATAVLVAPAVEESLYRGLLFTQAHGNLRTLFASLISCATFTLVHFAQYSSSTGQIHFGAITAIAALGLLCCLCRAALGRVWPSFIIHTSYNFFVALSLLSARQA